MTPSAGDHTIRTAAFAWLTEQVDRRGDVLPWKVLQRGFELDGERISLVSMPGIFKPRMMDLPLSIRSSPGGPYEDHFGPDGFLRYDYRGTDPTHPDNVGLRQAWREGVPLVYFFGISKGKYLAAWPVFIVDDRPADLQFSVAVDDARHAGVLRPEELLDAAHIIPDSTEEGIPEVSNGLALCKLHHAAFDRNFVGIRPDHVVEVRPDLMDQEDGPTLLHAIQGIHGLRIVVPRRREARPDPERLEARYGEFREGTRAS